MLTRGGLNKWLNKKLYGVEELPTLSLRYRIVQGINMLVIMVGTWVLSAMFTAITITGSVPWGIESIATLPPKDLPVVADVSVVEEFVEDNQEILETLFPDGFNCVEDALLAARNAHWQGVTAVPIKLLFEELEYGHMLLGFPTDEGWKFYDQDSRLWLNLVPGRQVFGYTVASVDYLASYNWVPITYEEAPND